MKRETNKPRRRVRASEPPAHYNVLTRPDDDGVVWHYPVRDVPNIVDAPQADAIYTPVMYMAARHVPARRRRGTERGTGQPSHAPIRFKSRARAVQFTIEAAKAERELLRALASGGLSA